MILTTSDKAISRGTISSICFVYVQNRLSFSTAASYAPANDVATEMKCQGNAISLCILTCSSPMKMIFLNHKYVKYNSSNESVYVTKDYVSAI